MEEAATNTGYHSEDEIKKRRDFREILTFTIDPVDAKDFDDAISIRVLKNGNYEIGVHIADVSHYVASRIPHWIKMLMVKQHLCICRTG